MLMMHQGVWNQQGQEMDTLGPLPKTKGLFDKEL